MNTDVQSAIQLKTKSFVEELTTLIRQAALHSVQAALDLDRRAPARAAAPLGRPGKRIRRSAASLNDVADRLYREIKARPGQRIENIAKNLGMPTKSLARPAKMLIASHRITTKGQKRATQYFAAN